MKKIILFSMLSAVAVYMPFINVAQASPVWCYLLLPPFNVCGSDHTSSGSVAPIRITPPSTLPPINWPSPTPVPYPTPAPSPISYGSGVGRAPVWQYTGSKSIVAGTTLQFNVIATDADGDYLYYALINPPNGAWFAANSGVFYWTPENNQVGTYTLSFTVTDGNNIVYQNVFVTVLSNGSQTQPVDPNPYPYPNPPGNGGYAPSWNQIGDKVAYVGEFLQFTVYAYSASAVNYQVINLPSGARFDTYSQLFSWNPTIGQLGTHIVTFRASNNYGTNDMVMTIRVVEKNPAPIPTPVPTPTPTPTPVPAPAPTEARIVFSNIKVENVSGDAVISWNTNIPATDRVIWDTRSEATQTGNFAYANATPDNTQLSTSHTVNLGKLDVGTTYYIRLVSKTSLQTRVSQEIAFVQVPEGQSQDLFGASLLAIFGKLFSNTGFLWVLILGFGTAAVVFYRKHKKGGLTV